MLTRMMASETAMKQAAIQPQDAMNIVKRIDRRIAEARFPGLYDDASGRFPGF